MAEFSRVPPHNLETEESLLGAMLLSRDAISAATEVGIKSSDFYRPIHSTVFDAILTLYADGEVVDPITVVDELRRLDKLNEIGGPAVLTTLQSRAPSTTGAAKYARIVQEYSRLRQLIAAAGQISEMAYGLPEDVPLAIDKAESLIFDINQQVTNESLIIVTDLLSETFDRLSTIYEHGGGIVGLPTGFIELDNILSGFQKSNLIVFGARPAIGKSALALNIAFEAAITHKKPVLFFSLEMSHSEIVQRLIASEGYVSATGLRTGRLYEADWTKMSDVVHQLSNAPLYIDDNPQTTLMEIRAKARRLRSRTGELGLIVVDYLQLMTGRSSAENRQVEVAEISRGLKVLARELETPVLALSQLSRNLESRADKRPMLSDLRETGAIEQDADVVAFLYRDEYYNPETPDRGIAEVLVAKHRSGPTGVARLVFLDQFTRFANLSV